MKNAVRSGLPTLLLLASIVGCASMGPAVTPHNSHIQMPHYSFAVPPGQGWHIQRFDRSNESAIITQFVGPFHFEIRIMRNVVSDDALKQANAKAVADDFRETEKQTMIEQGVDRGLYRIEDVIMGEETIDRLTFYTMSYAVTSDAGRQRAALYLWFPKPEQNEAFIVAHYSETMPSNSVLFKSHLPDFKRTLQTLAVR